MDPAGYATLVYEREELRRWHSHMHACNNMLQQLKYVTRCKAALLLLRDQHAPSPVPAVRSRLASDLSHVLVCRPDQPYYN